MSDEANNAAAPATNGQITEGELAHHATLADIQPRRRCTTVRSVCGVSRRRIGALYVIVGRADSRMRSSTVLILSLRSVAHETIKNLVLAGIGRLIVMDDGAVTEEDLGSGFLFREEEGAVGKNVSLLIEEKS